MRAVRSCGLASRGMKAGAVAAGSGFVFVDMVGGSRLCLLGLSECSVLRYSTGVDAEKQDVEYRNVANVSGELGNSCCISHCGVCLMTSAHAKLCL